MRRRKGVVIRDGSLGSSEIGGEAGKRRATLAWVAVCVFGGGHARRERGLLGSSETTSEAGEGNTRFLVGRRNQQPGVV